MPKPSTIRIGYEIGSGDPVDIPLGHLAVTGQTQQSGKTTTLEALVHRSGRRAIAFRTKLGEQNFSTYKFQPAFFTERADWQFVSSILEATLREKLRFERSWIMRVCKGAKTLREVGDNVHEALKTAKGLNQDIYYRLSEYLDLVVPQLEHLPDVRGEWLADNLVDGINVMDLSKYSSELQALVIRSVLQWVHDTQKNTIVVIPEAWEFIPEGRGSPVKLAAEHLIRKGAGLGDYVWLDSQDMAGVDAVIRKSVSVWIMGVQRADIEVKRTLAHLPAGATKPKPADVMQLGIGEFFVSFGRELKRVYVQPAWLESHDDLAVAIARGEVDARSVTRSEVPQSSKQKTSAAFDRLRSAAEFSEKEEKMWEQRYIEEKQRADDLQQRVETLEGELKWIAKARAVGNANSNGGDPSPRIEAGSPEEIRPGPLSVGQIIEGDDRFEDLYRRFRERLLTDPVALQVGTSQREIDVTVERRTVSMSDDTVQGTIALLLAKHFFTQPRGASEVAGDLARRGRGSALPNVCKALDKLTELGFLRVDGRKGHRRYSEVAEMKVNVVAA